MTPPPLLRVHAARIHARGSTLAHSLTFEVDGDRVALVGHFEPLLRVFTREATVASGVVEVLGQPADAAVPTGVLELDLPDALLPTSGTVLDFYTRSLVLSGEGLGGARRRAQKRAEALGVGKLSGRPLSSLHRTERRAVAIAHAGLCEAPVALLGDPLAGLDGAAAQAIVDLVDRIGTGRRLLVAFESPSATGPEAALLARMQQMVRLGPAGTLDVGTPAGLIGGAGRYAVLALRHVGSLERALVGQGHRVLRLAYEAPAGSATDTEEAPGRLLVHLAEAGDTRPVLSAALAVGAPIVELLPLGEGSDP